MGTSPLPNPNRYPPLGGSKCPDAAWGAGRALVLQGPLYCVGARWLLPANHYTPPVGLPVVIPPGGLQGPEGSIPYQDDLSTP